MIDGVDAVANSLTGSHDKLARQILGVLEDSGKRAAQVQRSHTRSSRVRDSISVRPQRKLGDSVSVWVGPAWTPPGEPNLPWIEEYGTARQAPHPFIEPSMAGRLEEIEKGISGLIGKL